MEWFSSRCNAREIFQQDDSSIGMEVFKRFLLYETIYAIWRPLNLRSTILSNVHVLSFIV